MLESEPPRYLEHVDGPVQFATVAAAGDTLGYLWFDDEQDAANFVCSADGGNRARNARGAWIRELLSAKSRGLTPSQAVAELAAEAGNARIGSIVAGTLNRASSVSAIAHRERGRSDHSTR